MIFGEGVRGWVVRRVGVEGGKWDGGRMVE